MDQQSQSQSSQSQYMRMRRIDQLHIGVVSGNGRGLEWMAEDLRHLVVVRDVPIGCDRLQFLMKMW
jgi:hypothetical protein